MIIEEMVGTMATTTAAIIIAAGMMMAGTIMEVMAGGTASVSCGVPGS
jgi:hypothetical protein